MGFYFYGIFWGLGQKVKDYHLECNIQIDLPLTSTILQRKYIDTRTKMSTMQFIKKYRANLLSVTVNNKIRLL